MHNISNFQTKDIGKIISLERAIAKRKSRKQPIEVLEKKLEQLCSQSQEMTSAISNRLPKIALEKDLPITAKANEIAELLKANQVIVVAGETGCGKTTQLPKICMQAGFGVRGKIGHTQPRRVAATSVANRIADELSTGVGQLVGYSVRFADKLSDATRIKLMTDGVLLAELQSDPMLSQYEVIIIDEAHERSLNIDFLLGFLNQLLNRRKDLRVIVTSATIDPQSFSQYFSNAPVVLVEGRTFPVEVIYQPLENDSAENDSYDDPILMGVGNAVDQCIVHSTGDILIFAHGEGEIKSIAKHLKQRQLTQTEIHPLFARLGIKEQQAIFKTANNRKIIIATNVAETSLTIPNIVFVIDIGTARMSRYSQRNKIQQLPVEKISQASADQRKGRCGRVSPGICIRLYSEEDFLLRPLYTEAEISRTNLSSVVLRLKSLRVKNVESFPFIQKPDERQWKVAFNLLFELAAVNNDRELTDIGRNMSKLALDPQLSRILLEPKLTAVDEMLIISSFLSVRDVRMRPHDKQQKADQCHQIYQDKTSDVISIINLWRHLLQQKKELSSSQFKKWCQKSYINFVGWLEWNNVYRQTKENLQDFNVKPTQQQAEADEIHRSLVCGFVSHILQKTQEHYYQGARGVKVWIHPSSVLFKKKQAWLLATELIETEKVFARGNLPIQAAWIEESVPHLIKNRYQDIHWRKSKGHAACYLNQTVLGLPITINRLFDCSKVEPIVSRELFLLDGLSQDGLNYDGLNQDVQNAGGLNQSFPFSTHNKELLVSIKKDEEKLRKFDIRISQEELASLYSKKIPETINTVFLLRKWLKKDWKKRNSYLCFDKEILIQREAESVEDYPSEIFVKGFSLPVSYCFAPGETEDGMTVDIPEQMVEQFRQEDFEWLVPGYLSEKIQAVIKTLPKPQRKQLIPISDTAEACYKEILNSEYQSRPFKAVLSEILLKLKDVRVEQELFRLEQLPDHLKMKFRNASSKKKNAVIAQELSSITSNKKQPKSHAKSNDVQVDKLYSWPNNFEGLETTVKKSNNVIRIFCGLVDKNDHVALQTFPDLISAQQSHLRGAARLLVLDQLRIVKELKNGWPDRKELEKLNIRNGGFNSLLDWLALSVAISIVKEHRSDLGSLNDFKTVSFNFAKTVRQKLSEQLRSMLKLLQEQNKIYLKLSGLKSDVYAGSVSDIKSQLNDLWCIERLTEQGEQIYQNYSRYYLATNSRITRIQENFPKEQLSLDNWSEWQEWWLDLSCNQLNSEARLLADELFWMLQEYRVSLFATNVKALGGVSSKKLQKKFELLEKTMDY